MTSKKTDDKPFLEIVGDVSARRIKTYAGKVEQGFRNRMQFENDLRPENMTIQNKLAKSSKQMTSPGIVALMIASAINEDFINRELLDGKRFNVYAFDKLFDVMTTLGAQGITRNAINRAIIKSMLAYDDAGIPFTGALAAAAASDKIKVAPADAKLLTRHSVSASTAPTQTSSTMNALMIAGIVTNKGLARMPIYELTETPAAERLRAVYAA